ncbi:MAG: hypothetical protein NTW26_08900 [bacterium]|nr:hypothetical protein [bacterium]
MVGINLYPGDGWVLFNNAIRYVKGEPSSVSRISWGEIKAAF